ncbi:MAG: hypothetical protein IJA16_03080 [Clostridia bacterium]|nr:hypothetical protein [Clostridia bacterium]
MGLQPGGRSAPKKGSQPDRVAEKEKSRKGQKKINLCASRCIRDSFFFDSPSGCCALAPFIVFCSFVQARSQAAPALRRGLRFFRAPLCGRQAQQAALLKVAAAAQSIIFIFAVAKTYGKAYIRARQKFKKSGCIQHPHFLIAQNPRENKGK